MKLIYIAAALLAATTSAGAWTQKTIPDRLGGKPIVILEQNLKIIDNPRGKANIILASIAIACDTVVLSFSDIIGGPKNAVVSIRAGNKPPMRKALEVAPNLRGAYASDAQAKKIIAYIGSEKILYGEVQSSTIGITSFEADVSGLKQALPSIKNSC